MIARFALLASFVVSSGIAFGQAAAEVIEPRDCALFSAVAAGSDHSSNAVPIARMGRASFWASWASLTGTLDGALKVQVASTAGPPAAGEWVDKTGATFVVSGATGANAISVTNLTERWARLVYTANNVTGGTVTANCHAKGI